MKNVPEATRIESAPSIEIGPGCYRKDLPFNGTVRVWVVDMMPGSEWPFVDHHDTGEGFLVVSGEIVEGDRRFGVGTYVAFDRGSRHQPRTETGARLFGFNPLL